MSAQELQREIDKLKEECRIVKMKYALNKKMIEIAEREYHIQIFPPGFKK